MSFSWLWGTSQLDDAVDKATSELLPAGQEDIALNLEICDQIRSKSVPAKDAMRALKRRLNHKNPNVQLLALGLTDICIKNGGDLFLVEIASREFMDNLVSILKIPALNHDVKQTILRLVQTWSLAFEGKQNLSYVGQVYKTLQTEGYKFPPKDLVATSSAMVDTQTAPEWIDSDVCLRCRTAFSFTNRKHHCRNCGQVFDQQCSSKSMPLPHFGITQEVRVCDGCHAKLTKKAEQHRPDKPRRRSSTRQQQPRDFADAELQRAIELSLREVGHARAGYTPAQPDPERYPYQSSEPPIVERSAEADGEDDPDLRAAIEASLREASAPRPSAPVVPDEPSSSYAQPQTQQQQHYDAPNYTYDLAPLEADAILTFSQTVEQVQAQGGRDMARYPAVGELYDKAAQLRPKLAMSLEDAGRKEEVLSEMHEKLSQAVKLYDQLLTQQVAQPRWRAAPQQAYQPPAANGYGQWAPQAQHVAAAGPSYQPPQTYQPQQVYEQPVQQAGSQYIASPAPAATHFAPVPAPPPVVLPQSPPPPPPVQRQYASPPPPAQHQPQPQHQPQHQHQQFASPPPPLPSSSPTLARHHSVAYARAPPGPCPGLTRSSTMVSSGSAPRADSYQHQQHQPVQHPQQHQHQQQQHQQQQVQQPVQQQYNQQQYAPPAPAAEPTLPSFPAVPSAPLQGYQAYAATPPERKEALLIDL